MIRALRFATSGDGRSLALAGALTLLLTASGVAQPSRPVRGIEGSLVLAGSGPVPDCVLQAFLHLCPRATKDIVIIRPAGGTKIPEKRWTRLGASSVHVVRSLSSNPKKLALPLLRAEGVWFEGPMSRLGTHPLFPVLLENVLARGGVVGGAGPGARALAHRGPRKDGFELMPNSVLHLAGAPAKRGAQALPTGSSAIEWTIPPSTALIVHHGRQVGALGESDVAVRIAPRNDWPERTDTLDAIDVFDPGDRPPYRLDLLAWLRSVQEREGPVFPPKKVAKPGVEKGTLILHGGAGVDGATFDRFIAAAGGKGSRFVCIPSASEFHYGDLPSSYSAKRLRKRGCSNVVILHTVDPHVADRDRQFLAPLENANGVWIDGGRTYRVMDSYQHTRAHRLLREVLARGGVIGGSSAGCQVAGDFLVRGNPRTNRDLVFAGYTTGLGLIEGVILDAHFRQRNREEGLAGLIRRHPQMLGVGVDERTALIVRGHVGEVLGQNAVSFYAADSEATVLKSGAAYNLAARKPVVR